MRATCGAMQHLACTYVLFPVQAHPWIGQFGLQKGPSLHSTATKRQLRPRLESQQLRGTVHTSIGSDVEKYMQYKLLNYAQIDQTVIEHSR